MRIQLRVRPTGHGVHEIEVLQPDRPFLFRSFLEALKSLDLKPRRLQHPLLVETKRGGRRTLRAARQGDACRLSYISCLAAPTPGGGAFPSAAKIRARLLEVFREVERATEGFESMKEKARASIAEVRRASVAGAKAAAERSEAAALLSWLLDGNFVFLRVQEHKGGVGRRLPLVAVEKADEETLVYRAGRMDAVAVARTDEKGRRVGTRVFLGHFADRAEQAPKTRIPVLRRKYEVLRKRLGLVPDSHDDHALRRLYEGYPLDLLFASKPGDLMEELALSIEGPGEEGVRLAFRHDPVRRGLSLTVVMEEAAFHQPLAAKIVRLVERALETSPRDVPTERPTRPEVRFHLDSPSSTARIHVFFPTQRPLTKAKEKRLRAEILTVATRWETAFEEALRDAFGEEEGLRLARKYATAFPDQYRILVSPRLAVSDTRDLEATLEGGGLYVSWGESDEDSSYLKVYSPDRRLPLATLSPVVSRHGLKLLTETSYPIAVEGRVVHMHILQVTPEDGGGPVDLETDGAGDRLVASMLPAFAGEAEVDRLSGLVLRAGFTAREVALFRALHGYVRQLGTVHTRRSIHNTLLAHPKYLKHLLHLFRLRLDPAVRREGGLKERIERVRKSLAEYLSGVSSLDEDRILRAFRDIVEAIVRTNYFLEGRETVAFKVDTTRLTALPTPRPWREVFVSGPTIEGVHIRFGKVARGGIRWSERADDFRTEILDLAITQTVKNAQIVPTGAKGGFVLRRRDPSARPSFAEVEEGYKVFIRALLDLVDNRVAGEVVHPKGVVCHDGDDPYFVVAADKGTATFSDLANALAAERDFWLDDAFASGGSNGYDHKGLGITARGAWEAAKRHWKEMGVSEEEVTVVGIGDMSGDVFGNGMLLSKKIRLIAAFDHRHIFLDPDPDPAASWKERKRLFEKPRSSWADYDKKKISKGGGVYPRTAKRIRLSAEARKALGTDERVLDGEGLIRAVLKAPATMLYNGGIGTYVKSEDESDAEVGDAANDAVRVNAEELRVRCVVEGGNLGFTMPARVAFARRGGRIHTDSMDNAAGVTLSDREVNLKILLARDKNRRRVVKAATQACVAATLADVSDQFLSLSLDAARIKQDPEPFFRLLADLERRGLVDRKRHDLPDAEELADRRARGEALFIPEIAILFASAKIDYVHRLLESPLLNHPALEAELRRYFPDAVGRKYAGRFAVHPLRRELIATTLVNRIMNRHGAAFLLRMTANTGLAASRVTEGILHAERILDLEAVDAAIDEVEDDLPPGAAREARLTLSDCAEEVAIWLIREIGDLRENLEELPGYDDLLPKILRDGRTRMPSEERAIHDRIRNDLAAKGFPDALAATLAATRYFRLYLDAARIAERKVASFDEAVEVLFAIGLKLSYPKMIDRLESLAQGQPGMRTAVRIVVFDLRRARRRIAERALLHKGGLEGYLEARPRSFATIRSVVDRVVEGEGADLPAFVTLTHQIENLASV